MLDLRKAFHPLLKVEQSNPQKQRKRQFSTDFL